MHLEELSIRRDISIRDAIKILDLTGKKILLVIENDILIGTLRMAV